MILCWSIFSVWQRTNNIRAKQYKNQWHVRFCMQIISNFKWWINYSAFLTDFVVIIHLILRHIWILGLIFNYGAECNRMLVITHVICVIYTIISALINFKFFIWHYWLFFIFICWLFVKHTCSNYCWANKKNRVFKLMVNIVIDCSIIGYDCNFRLNNKWNLLFCKCPCHNIDHIHSRNNIIVWNCSRLIMWIINSINSL